MASKIFEVNEVLPATTQLRISWDYYLDASYEKILKTDSDNFQLFQNVFGYYDYYFYINGIQIYWADSGDLFFTPPYTDFGGDHPYIDIDTSTWSLAKRTVSTVYFGEGEDYANFLWEDLNAPQGYTITFNSNGGTTNTERT